MANAVKDQNNVSSLIGVSSADLKTPTRIAANPATGAVLIDGPSLYADLDPRYLASGSGDVTGPASATDENITVFDGVTGKLIKDSGVNISDVTANTSARHSALTVTDSSEINFTLTGQDLTASLVAGSIDETKLDTSVNASLDLADSATQPGDLATVATTGSHTDLTNIGTNTHAQIDTFIASKSSANGLASLDGGGKVPVSQLPSSIMEYQGTWNATTNSPTLADGTGGTGDVYRVSVAGSQDLGSGSITFNIGDYIIYNGTIWEKSDTTDAVSTVAGKTGNVVLDSGDITDFDTEVSNNTDVSANTTARHSPLTLSGTPDYLTLSGQAITLNQVDLTTDVTGLLPIANGGLNNNATPTSGRILVGDGSKYGLNNSLNFRSNQVEFEPLSADFTYQLIFTPPANAPSGSNFGLFRYRDFFTYYGSASSDIRFQWINYGSGSAYFDVSGWINILNSAANAILYSFTQSVSSTGGVNGTGYLDVDVGGVLKRISFD